MISPRSIAILLFSPLILIVLLSSCGTAVNSSKNSLTREGSSPSTNVLQTMSSDHFPPVEVRNQQGKKGFATTEMESRKVLEKAVTNILRPFQGLTEEQQQEIQQWQNILKQHFVKQTQKKSSSRLRISLLDSPFRFAPSWVKACLDQGITDPRQLPHQPWPPPVAEFEPTFWGKISGGTFLEREQISPHLLVDWYLDSHGVYGVLYIRFLNAFDRQTIACTLLCCRQWYQHLQALSLDELLQLGREEYMSGSEPKQQRTVPKERGDSSLSYVHAKHLARLWKKKYGFLFQIPLEGRRRVSFEPLNFLEFLKSAAEDLKTKVTPSKG